MDRDERDPIFMDEGGFHPFCFDTCDRFGLDCRHCERLAKGANAN